MLAVEWIIVLDLNATSRGRYSINPAPAERTMQAGSGTSVKSAQGQVIVLPVILIVHEPVATIN